MQVQVEISVETADQAREARAARVQLARALNQSPVIGSSIADDTKRVSEAFEVRGKLEARDVVLVAVAFFFDKGWALMIEQPTESGFKVVTRVAT